MGEGNPVSRGYIGSQIVIGEGGNHDWYPVLCRP